jgi:DNA invertase Pin-like site-specific DNA recombinase
MIAEKDIDAIRTIIDDEEKTKAVLTVIQEMEVHRKEQYHRRQADGIAAAKERGVRFGRPKMTFPKNFEGIYNCYRSKAITAVHASEVLGINRNSFRELVKRYEESQGISDE